ncbi:MAG TPA: lipopolysaccharide biosynthesis protein [Thermoanaerobaculia bacterium]|nr:lipopolysaccharide biosynthesis protein [Thermoanaerobaculia bacterium]
MKPEPPPVVRRLLGGGAFVMAAEILQLPSTILLAAYLSRKVGAEGLGLYLYAAAVVITVEVVVSTLFSRATVQLVAETPSWQPVASLVLRWHVGVGVAALLLLWAAVAPFAVPFGVPGLRQALLLFSLEIPLSALARTHTHVLVGLGRFRERAASSAARWVGRLVLAVAFVEMGLGVRGAVLGAVGSTALELLVARRFVAPRWGLPAPEGLRRRLFGYSLPLFLHGASLQLFNRLGLLLLVPLGASVAAAGLYGAADSLMRLRRILGQSLTPLVLTSLTELLRDGARGEARSLARAALRGILLTVVPVAAVAGAAPQLMAWLFGDEFRAGGPLLAVLMWAAPGFLVISIAAAVLVAAGKPGSTVRLTVPMVPLALVGYALAVPRYGALGAAVVTSATVVVVAVACLGAVHRLWRVAPPLGTLARGALIAPMVYLGAGALPQEGWWLVLELPLLAAAGLGLFLALGEASGEELQRLRRWFGGAPAAAGVED